MARRVIISAALAVLAVAIGMVAATSTTPQILQGYSLPMWYLVNNGSSFSVVRQPTGQVLASGQYNESMNDLGYDYLLIDGAGDYYSGYLEGYLTADRINLMGIPSAPTGPTGAWLSKHIAYMNERSSHLASSSKFWNSVKLQLAQVQGVADGAAAKLKVPVSFTQAFLLSFGPELGDVQTAVANQTNKFRQRWKPSHCSAMIRVTHDDLYVAHDTWDVFEGMAYRQYKVYRFNGITIGFTSHPGDLSSTDDWYVISTELAVQETTNGVMNLGLYTAVVPETVSEFIRVMAANYLATSGEEWTTYFALENSGTYNNQYMVVDFKKFVPGATIVPGTLWVAEQLPGIVARGDQSAVLAAQGYWGSYNIPFYPEIYKLSGYLQDYQEYGNFYSYTKYARGEIFARNSSQISTLSDMMRMMRYNNYQTDPLSRIQNCSGAPNGECLTPQTAMLSIASRGDLMTVYPTDAENIQHYGPLYGFLAQGCFGAIDSKIAAWSQRRTLKSWVISGPSNDQQPTFQWNTGACQGHPAPPGTPTTVDFPWVEVQLMPDP